MEPELAAATAACTQRSCSSTPPPPSSPSLQPSTSSCRLRAAAAAASAPAAAASTSRSFQKVFAVAAISSCRPPSLAHPLRMDVCSKLVSANITRYCTYTHGTHSGIVSPESTNLSLLSLNICPLFLCRRCLFPALLSLFFFLLPLSPHIEQRAPFQ